MSAFCDWFVADRGCGCRGWLGRTPGSAARDKAGRVRQHRPVAVAAAAEFRRRLTRGIKTSFWSLNTPEPTQEAALVTARSTHKHTGTSGEPVIVIGN